MQNKKNNYFNNVKQFINIKTLKSLKFLPKTLGKNERIFLIVLGLAVIVSGIFIWEKYWISQTHEVPAKGGILTEGIVGQSKDLEKHVSRLTGAGLTRLVENGDVKGDLAESWQVLDDGKTYQFKIRQGYSANDLLSQIQNKNIWSSIEMSAPDDQTLVFKFKAAFSPFLYVSTEPIFNYGPYQITKEEKEHVTLTANKNYWQGEPNISKIEINIYPNQDSLLKAAKNGEIMGYLKENKEDFQISNATTYDFTLPRELNLFFNLSKPDLQNLDRRRALRDNTVLDKDINLTLVTSENSKNIQIAQNLKQKWLPLKVNLEVKTYNNITLQKDIIPNRQYDILLYGQDYGPDPDPYPFWHSSQNKADGMNLSNYSVKDADKLLEDARQTFDFNIRNQKYEEFRKILNDQIPYINIERTTYYYTLSNKVKGVTKIYGSSEADRFLNVSQWYIKSKRVKN